MYIRKIVLADDEGTQLKILSSLIHRLTPATELALCCDGQEAWQAIQEGDAELLITDIRMPSMDGMELISRVSAQYPHIAIVLISAYQEFDYARSAISCGVSEYLIKPFRVEDIRRLLSKMQERISALHRDAERSMDYEALLEQNLRDERQKLLLGLLYAVRSPKPSPLYDALADSLRRPGLLVVLRWITRTAPAGVSPPAFALSRRRQEILTEHIRQIFSTQALVPLENPLNSGERRLALLLPGFRVPDCQAALKRLMELCQEEEIVFQAGISSEQEELFPALNASLCQAQEALSFSFYFPGRTMLFSCADERIGPDLPLPSLSGFEKDIRRAVHTGNLTGIREVLLCLKRELSREPLLSPSRVRHGVSSLTVSLIKDLDGMVSSGEYDSILNDAYHLYSGCDALEDLFSISLSLLERTAACFSQESGQYDTVEDVIAFVKKHFTEELSLKQLADQVHFSASYLSAQILKKTGMTYSSYLGYLRTEKARQLLLETDLKVMDIASACGYRDSSYFNRIFHRKYGTSPEQYRKAHKKC